MSLNYYLTEICDYDEVCYIQDGESGGYQLNPELNTLIWSTLGMGISGITPNNHDLWLERCKALELVGRSIAYTDKHTPWIPSKETLRIYTGLRTNADNTTNAAFYRQIGKYIKEEALDYANMTLGRINND